MDEEINIPNNLEIDKALKEFEAKSGAEQTQKTPEAFKNSNVPQREISGVKFESDSWKAVKFYNETTPPKIIQLVMKYSGGAIKEQGQAEYVLFGLVVLTIFVSVFLFFNGTKKNTLPPQEIIDNALNRTIENLGN